jgi:hypothetical protein
MTQVENAKLTMAKSGGSKTLKDLNRWQIWLIIAANAYRDTSVEMKTLIIRCRELPRLSNRTSTYVTEWLCIRILAVGELERFRQ